MSTMSAARAVLDTNELFEAILLLLPLRTLLLAQRFDHRWHTMIANTKKVQQKLFMSPVSTTAEAFAVGCHFTCRPDPPTRFDRFISMGLDESHQILNPLVFNMEHVGRHNTTMTIHQDQMTTPGQTLPKKKRFHPRKRRRITPPTKRLLNLSASLKALLEPGATAIIPPWTRMLLTQPPLDQLQYQVYYAKEDDFSRRLLQGKIFLGEVVHELLRSTKEPMGPKDWVKVDLRGSSNTT